MLKYLVRLLMTLFFLLGTTVFGAPAPGSSSIGTQATITYTDTNGQNVTVTSNTVVFTVNTVRGVSVTPTTANYSARAGQNVSFPVTITNTGNVADTYKVYTANDSALPNIIFTVDTNGNGVLDAGESTVIPAYGVTPSIASGASLKLIVTGTIPTTAVNGTILSSIVHARSNTDSGAISWSENRFTIADVANVIVNKTAVNTGVANQLAFDLQLTNSAAVASGLVTITDTLPTNATVVGTTASWTPAGQTVAKNITYADDGAEPNSNEVTLKVVNGVLTFTHTAMPANSTIGGVLRVVMSYTGLTGGTKIENRASYTYNNGTTTVGPFSTATAVYAVPETTAAVEISTEVTLTAFAGDYITVPQIVLNRGNVAASYNLTVENTTYVTNPVFYVDTNGDGIHQSNETTVITNTGTLNPGQSIRIIMKGLVGGGTPVGTNTFRIYARATTGTVSDWSDITLNVLQAGTVVTIGPDTTVATSAGQTITIPQTIANLGNTSESFILSLSDTSKLQNVSYIVDTNGDGIRQAGETTQITAPLFVSAGGTAKIFLVATVPTGTTGSLVERLYVTSQSNLNAKDWSDITINTTTPAAVAVTKAIKNNTFPGVFDYSLKITNPTGNTASALVITDTLPTTVTAQGTDAKWYPFGEGTNYKWVSYADNGPEITSNDVSFKLLSGVATLSYLGNVPANVTSTSLGGELIISVKVNSGVAYGTVIANTANFTYNNGVTTGVTGTSNTVNYTVPTPFNGVNLANDLTINAANGEQVVIPQSITNKTGAAATYSLSMDSTTALTNVKYYLDANGDGIRQYNENTEIVGGQTSSVGAGGMLYFFIVGNATSTTASQYTFKVYAVSNVSTSDYDFSTITLNIGLPGVLVDVAPEITQSTYQGATITIAQTITNKTATADTYALSLSGTAVFSSYQFILDTNGDGIRQAGETTVVTTTSSVAANNGTYKFFLVGTLRTDLQATETFRIMVKSTTNNLAVDWSGVTLNVSSTPPAAVAVTKSIINNTFPGVFDYSLKITNTSATEGTALVITDTLPTTVTAQGTDAKWYPFGNSSYKWASYADNGPEITSNDISFKLISGVATLSYLGNVPANTTSTSIGGELVITVKVNSGVAYGTVIANTANFTYNNGIAAGTTGTSNTVNYTVPTPFNAVDLSTDLTINAAVGETLTIPQTILNKTTSAASYKLSIENTTLLQNVKYYVDTNGDGIRQYTETTEIVNGITPSIAQNQSLKIFVVGKVDSTLGAGQQVTKIFAVSQTNVGDYDFSTITLNLGLAGNVINLTPDVTVSTSQGAQVVIAQSLINKSATADTYTLSIAEGNPFASYQFILDTNGDGVLQAGETTVVTTTPSVAGNNGTYKFFLVGTLRTGLQATETFKIFARSTTNNASVDWSTVTLNVAAGATANVAVTKSIINNSFPGVFDYSLKITNSGGAPGTGLIITDNLPGTVTAQGDSAKWYPFGWNSFKWVTYADNGPEVISDDVAFKLVNGQAVLTVYANVPANTTAASQGGELIISVKVNSNVAYGTVIGNQAQFIYNNGATGVTGSSNLANYTVPTPFNAVDLASEKTLNVSPGEVVSIPQTLTNKTASATSYNLSLDNTNVLTNLKYYVDTNGDGIRQATENTEIVGGITPSVAGNNGTLKFFVVGTVNGSIGQSLVKLYATSSSNISDYDWSEFIFNIAQAGVLVDLAPETSLTVAQGANVIIPQTITNKSSVQDSYMLSITGENLFESYGFVIDDNGDGSKGYQETTPITTTPAIPPNGIFKFFLVGKLRSDLPASTGFRIYAKSVSNSNSIDWSGVGLTVTAQVNRANLNVVQSIGTTVVPGAYVYVFDLTNTSTTTAATAIEVQAQLPSGVIPDTTFGVWTPPGGSATNVDIGDTGVDIQPGTAFIVRANGELTFKLDNLPVGGTGRLVLRVRPTGGLASGTVLQMTGSYTYNDGVGNAAGNTNTTYYTIPDRALVSVSKTAVKHPSIAGQFIYKFGFSNTGSAAATNIILTDGLPDTVEVVGTSSTWYPVGWSTAKDITNANDGWEVISDEVNLNITNDGIRNTVNFTITTIPGNTPESTAGGELWVYVRPKVGVTNGTIIPNIGIFQYTYGGNTITDQYTSQSYYTVAGGSAVVTKSIGTTVEPGAFVYIFDIVSTGSGAARDIGILDTLPTGIIPTLNYAVWTKPNGTQVNLTNADDGTETNDSNIYGYNLVNGKLYFVVNTLNSGETGRLAIRVKPTPPLKAGDTVTNKASYNFSDGTYTQYLETNPVSYTIPSPANVEIVKSINTTAVPGEFEYAFKIKNSSGMSSPGVVLTDILPSNISPRGTDVKWAPFGYTTYKWVTMADDGPEVISNEINFKLVNGVATLNVLNEVPGNVTSTTLDGELVIPVKVNTGVTPGTIISNSGTYTYNNRYENITKTTNTANYTVPLSGTVANIGVNKTIETVDAATNTYRYVFTINNTGGAGSNFILTDGLPAPVQVQGTTATWQPFGASTSVDLTVADDGAEANANTSMLKIVQNALTFNLSSVPANGANGVLKITVKVTSGVTTGTVLSNTALFSYFNGLQNIAVTATNTASYTVQGGTAVLTLQKLQAIDANNDNVPDGAYSTTGQQANPGAKIFYKLVVTNTGTGAATNVVVNDSTANFTTMSYGDGNVGATGKPSWRIGTGTFTEIGTKPASGATGQIQLTIPNLGAGQVAEIYYNVKVDQ
ncbi:beta strand repeat-containing protein [Cetobacterium sp. SF1]|uniref:beta strand repeat-containing protein n=1 Tax=Cetobacterium sp. SF1 TaxID=3417654 RepID=UPI003CF01C37